MHKLFLGEGFGENICYGLVPCILSLDHGMGIKKQPWYVNSQNDGHISLICQIWHVWSFGLLHMISLRDDQSLSL